MSILHHFCEQCGHPDYYHGASECSYGYCKCRVDSATMTTAPTLSPTWSPSGAPVLTVTPPATRWPEQGQGHKTCGCDACHQEYARLTAGVA